MTKKGGLADSPFFKQAPIAHPESESQRTKKITKPRSPKKNRRKKADDVMTSSNHAITTSINHDSKQSSNHDIIIADIRKTVRVIGKDLTSLRLTPEETKALRDVAYTYECQGFKTSRNEIARIGVNYLISDYRENGENSILEKVLKALKA